MIMKVQVTLWSGVYRTECDYEGTGYDVVSNIKAQNKPRYDSRCAFVLQLDATVLQLDATVLITADGYMARYRITKYGLSCANIHLEQ